MSWYYLSAVLAHNLYRELQMICDPATRTTTAKRAALWVFEEATSIRQQVYPTCRSTDSASWATTAEAERKRCNPQGLDALPRLSRPRQLIQIFNATLGLNSAGILGLIPGLAEA